MHVSEQLKKLGNTATHAGWRRAVSDRVAPAIANRTSTREDVIRGVLGLLLLALSIKYVASTLRSWRHT